MRAAELLRGIATMLANIEDTDTKQAVSPVIVNVNTASNNTEPVRQTEPQNPNQAVLTPIKPDEKTELSDKPVMMPPLQQKIELMKKMAGMPNQADNFNFAVTDEDEPFEG
jgi:hypothetical protein